MSGLDDGRREAARAQLGDGAGGTDAVADPLARIGERLVEAERERRRRLRQARQRIAGAVATVVAVVALVVAAGSFGDGSSTRSTPAARVELAVPGGRFAVYASEHDALCADRPSGRDPAGSTVCASIPLVAATLDRDGSAWLTARIDGDQVVVSGLAEMSVERVVLSTTSIAGGQRARERSFVGGRPVTVTSGGERLTARPFVASVRYAGGPGVRVAVSRVGVRTGTKTVVIGDTRPSGTEPGSSLLYAVSGGESAARVAARAQARLATVGPGLSQVIGDGSRLTVELPSRTPQPIALAREALAPGVLRFYDWEASALLPEDGRTVAEGLAAGLPRATTISRTAGASGGMRLGIAETLAQLPRNLNRPHVRGAVVQALGPGGGPSVVPRSDPRARFYVLEGSPALTGLELVDPRAVRDGGQPRVRFDLTANGRAAFQRVTRAISQRGQSLMLPGTDPAQVAQHLAVVLDGRLLSLEAIDPQRFPDGLDGDDGAEIAGSFTAAEAERLARLLDLGPLPALRELR